jgi:diguanylate cyclase (GGDEF)-like protein
MATRWLHAENGRRAVELFPHYCPDLILMDIEMPVMNGFDATNRIREIEASQQWAWTPIIFLASSDTVENLVTAIDAGGDDFLSKLTPEPVIQAKMKAMSRIATLRHQLSAANAKLQALADFDGLTGLHNRRSMDRKLDELWALATRERAPFGLLMIDIDNFKKYNDHYGHQEGDECLRAVARTIESAAQAANADRTTGQAFSARYGGEEFSVVVPLVSAVALEGPAAATVDAVHALAIAHERNESWGVVTISAGAVRVAASSGALAATFPARRPEPVPGQAERPQSHPDIPAVTGRAWRDPVPKIATIHRHFAPDPRATCARATFVQRALAGTLAVAGKSFPGTCGSPESWRLDQ